MAPYGPRRPCPRARDGCPHLAPCPIHRPSARWGNVGTAESRGYRSSAWPRIRARFLRAHPDCARCGQPAQSVDHIVSKARGGTDDEENLQALCDRCHRAKTARGG